MPLGRIAPLARGDDVIRDCITAGFFRDNVLARARLFTLLAMMRHSAFAIIANSLLLSLGSLALKLMPNVIV